MSHLYAGHVFARYPGSRAAREVLTWMVLHMEHRRPDKPVECSAERLAELEGLGLTDARCAIRELRRDGYITATGNGKGGRSIPNPYTVNVAKIMALPDRSKSKSGEVPPVPPQFRGRARRASVGKRYPPATPLDAERYPPSTAKGIHRGPEKVSTGDTEQGLYFNKGLNKATAVADAEPSASIATSPPVRNTGTTNPRPNGAETPPPDVNPGLQEEDQPMPDDADELGRIPMPDHIRALLATTLQKSTTHGPRPPAPPRRVNGHTDGPPPPDPRPTAREAAEKARQAAEVQRMLREKSQGNA